MIVHRYIHCPDDWYDGACVCAAVHVMTSAETCVFSTHTGMQNDQNVSSIVSANCSAL